MAPVAWVLAACLIALWFWAAHSGLIPERFEESFWTPLAVGLALSLVIAQTIRSVARPPKEARSECILRKQIDVYHRRWRYIYILMVYLMFEQGIGLTLPHFRNPGANAHAWITPAVFVFTASMSALLVCFGPGFLHASQRRALNDELTRALRARAALFGYLIAVTGLGAAYLAFLYKPLWGAALLPPLLATAIALPALIFVFLEWRADRGD